MEFSTLGKEERKLFLKAIKVPTQNMQCYYCAERVDYRTCGIMPPLERGERARITCSSPLCICEYLEDVENAGKVDERMAYVPVYFWCSERVKLRNK